MRIGVKYCGGCNPNYNRKAAIEMLKSKWRGCSIEPVNEKEGYDKILLVCGCARTCIRNFRIAGCEEYIVVQTEKNLEDMGSKKWM